MNLGQNRDILKDPFHQIQMLSPQKIILGTISSRINALITQTRIQFKKKTLFSFRRYVEQDSSIHKTYISLSNLLIFRPKFFNFSVIISSTLIF